MEILEHLEQMKEKYQVDDTPLIISWEEEAKKLIIIEQIAGSDAIKFLTDKLNDDVKKMDELLLSCNSEIMSDAQRDRLLDKKELYKQVVSFFDVETSRKNLEKIIKDSE